MFETENRQRETLVDVVLRVNSHVTQHKMNTEFGIELRCVAKTNANEEEESWEVMRRVIIWKGNEDDRGMDADQPAESKANPRKPTEKAAMKSEMKRVAGNFYASTHVKRNWPSPTTSPLPPHSTKGTIFSTLVTLLIYHDAPPSPFFSSSVNTAPVTRWKFFLISFCIV